MELIMKGLGIAIPQFNLDFYLSLTTIFPDEKTALKIELEDDKTTETQKIPPSLPKGTIEDESVKKEKPNAYPEFKPIGSKRNLDELIDSKEP